MRHCRITGWNLSDSLASGMRRCLDFDRDVPGCRRDVRESLRGKQRNQAGVDAALGLVGREQIDGAVLGHAAHQHWIPGVIVTYLVN